MEQPVTRDPTALVGVIAGRTYGVQSKAKTGFVYVESSTAAPAARVGAQLRNGEWAYVTPAAGESIWVSGANGGVFYAESV